MKTSINYQLLTPHDILEKAKREQNRLKKAINSQDKDMITDSVFNFAVTAYHITDWVMKSNSK